MKRRSVHPSLPLSAAALSSALLASCPQHAAAQTVIPWNGSLNNVVAGDWSTASNWTSSNIPDSNTEIADLRKDWTGTAPTISLNADYTVNGLIFDDTGTVTDVAMVINAGNTLTLAGTAARVQVDAGTLTITGPLAGSAAWSKTNGGTLNLLDNNPGLTGATTISGSAISSGAGTVNLGSATVSTGALTNSTAITITNAGVLSLQNTVGIVDRIGDATPVTLSLGGTLTLVHNATNNTTETIGAINLDRGSSTIGVSSAASRVTALAAASFNRGSANATVLVRGTSLTQSVATNVARITLADGGASLNFVGATTLNNGATGDTTKTLKIVPWMFGDSSATGTGNNFVTYDTTLGLRVLSTSQTTTLSAAYATPGTTENVGVAANLALTGSAISVNSLLFKTAAAALTSTSANALTVQSGAVGTTGAFAFSIGNSFSSLDLGNGEGVLTASTGSTLTVATPINVSASGGLTKAGAGTLAITAAPLYTGPTRVNAGTLTFNVPNSLSGKFTVAAGTLNFNTIENVGGPNSALGAPTTVANGTIDVGGALAFNGTVAASSDRIVNLIPSADARFPTLRNDGTAGLTLTGGITGTESLLVRGAGGPITITGLTANTGAIMHTEAQTLTLSNPNNSFGGPLAALAGTISVDSISHSGVASAIGTGNTIYLGQASAANTGKLQFTGASGGSTNRPIVVSSTGTTTNGGIIENTVAGQLLTLSGGISAGPDALAALTGTVPSLKLTGDGDGLESGNITGPGLTLTKEGAGTWTLTGSLNNYTGETKVSVGKLIVNGDNTAAAGNITVASGATLGGSGKLGGVLTVASGGILQPGNSPGGTLTTNTSVVLNNLSVLNWDLNGGDTTVGGGVNDLMDGITIFTLDGVLNVTETVPLSFSTALIGSTWRIANYTGALTDNGLTVGTTPTLPAGASLSVTAGGGQVNLVLIPEASSTLLAGLAAMLSPLRRRRLR